MTSEKSGLLQGEAGPSHRYGTVKSELNQKDCYRTNFSRRDCILVFGLFALASVGIGLSLGYGLPALEKKRAAYFDLTSEPSDSPLKFFSDYVVATDADHCAPIGATVLKDNGSAVDAAIATLFCNGAVHPHAMGIGGGVIFTIYDQKTKTATVIDGREMAPAGSENLPKEHLSTGNLSIGVPGELRAYEEAHRLFGKLPWERLVQPTIDLCKNGFAVTKHFASALIKNRDRISKDANLRSAYFNKEKNRVFVEGEIITCPQLAITLEKIRDERAETFYEGEIAEKLLADLAAYGANLKAEDLKNYKVEQRTALKKTLSVAGLTIHCPPPPGDGPILSLILAVLDKCGYTPGDEQEVSSASEMVHQIAESIKFGYAAKTHLGDEKFLKNKTIVEYIMSDEFADEIRNAISNVTHPEEFYRPLSRATTKEHGTAHVSVLVSGEVAVSATSSVNAQFGSFIRSSRTGILLNNHMSDFTVDGPADGPNAVVSKKRPMSSMSPSVFVDSNGVPRLVLGGIGGTRITSGEAQVAFRHLYLGQDVKTAIDAPRLHNQLFPNELLYQERFPGILLENLSKRGHKVVKEHDLSAMNAVSMDAKGIYANVDYRKGGSIAGL